MDSGESGAAVYVEQLMRKAGSLADKLNHPKIILYELPLGLTTKNMQSRDLIALSVKNRSNRRIVLRHLLLMQVSIYIQIPGTVTPILLRRTGQI